MTVLEKMQEMLPDFSKNERRIADHILKYPHDLERYSAVSMAEVCNVSRSAVIRFCQKLGFTGFLDLRDAVKHENRTTPSASAAAPSTALEVYKQCIDQLQEQTDPDEISAISSLMIHSRRVLCYGVDHSRYSAQQMAFRLSRCHVDATYSGDDTILENFIRLFGPGDTVVIFSITGQKSYRDHIEQFRAKRVSVVLFTMNAGTPLSNCVDHMLVLPSAVHSNSPYMLDDMICFLLGIELIIEDMQKKTDTRSQ